MTHPQDSPEFKENVDTQEDSYKLSQSGQKIHLFACLPPGPILYDPHPLLLAVVTLKVIQSIPRPCP